MMVNMLVDKFYEKEDFRNYVENLEYKLVKKHNKSEVTYLNIPCVFDIEVTSFYSENEKRATMYAFTLGVDGVSYLGRTWDEFLDLINFLVSTFSLGDSKRLIIYVHNLSYEFQFLRKRFNFTKVFSISERTPVYALTDNGIEFRCSYILSGYSLAKLGDNLHKFKVKKMVGDLDYSLPRNYKTPLTEKEKGYILNDGLVVMAYIYELIEDYNNNIAKIPLTNTGKVREYCRKHTIRQTRRISKYQELMKKLVINDGVEYQQLKRAFQGGFTHANLFNVDKVFKDVTSYDFTSSYPAVMLMEQFPMSKFTRVKITSDKQFNNLLNKYCCLFDITFYDLEKINYIDSPLSLSKCFNVDHNSLLTDNGRIYECKKLTTTLTEQDFFILKKFYKWSKFEVFNFKYAFRSYLPRELLLCILKLYGDKTTLKGVKGKEKEYLNSKGMLNSIYGMSVTDIVKAKYEYESETDTWSKELTDEEELNKIIDKYNKSWNRFLFYAWGVWVTVYARRNLFKGILECKEDYIYSDTDSIKILNAIKHKAFIDSYNEEVKTKLERMCYYRNIDYSLCEPKTIKGEKKLIGVWDYDGHYIRFKTLGAKRYMTELDNGEIHYTIAGLPKDKCIDYIKKKGRGDPFKYFNDNMVIPKEESHKNLHTYIDFETKGTLTDYLGNSAPYHEFNALHIEQTSFTLTLSEDYISMILGRFNLRRFD